MAKKKLKVYNAKQIPLPDEYGSMDINGKRLDTVLTEIGELHHKKRYAIAVGLTEAFTAMYNVQSEHMSPTDALSQSMFIIGLSYALGTLKWFNLEGKPRLMVEPIPDELAETSSIRLRSGELVQFGELFGGMRNQFRPESMEKFRKDVLKRKGLTKRQIDTDDPSVLITGLVAMQMTIDSKRSKMAT